MTATSGPPKTFFTVRETAEALRVDPATIYRAIRDNAFPAVRLRGRYVIPVRAVEELADRAVESGGCLDVADLARERAARAIGGFR